LCTSHHYCCFASYRQYKSNTRKAYLVPKALNYFSSAHSQSIASSVPVPSFGHNIYISGTCAYHLHFFFHFHLHIRYHIYPNMTLDRSAKTSALANNTAGETTSLLNASDGIDRTDSTSIDSSHVSKSPQASGAPSPNATQPADEEKPFPVWQITILCYASIVEPLAFYIIFPYISEMVERVGNQLPENVGFWTGIIESLFSILQMVLIMFYGRIADHWGRKPVLVFSLTGIGAASALFGMSSTLWQMVIFRCLAGFFAGSSATIRAMLSENCTKATQGKAFGWFMFARYVRASMSANQTD
jgi:hypothetical protein